ncbi:hypothetical protein L9F63_009515, partial [Diploptera punctata]
ASCGMNSTCHTLRHESKNMMFVASVEDCTEHIVSCHVMNELRNVPFWSGWPGHQSEFYDTHFKEKNYLIQQVSYFDDGEKTSPKAQKSIGTPELNPKFGYSTNGLPSEIRTLTILVTFGVRVVAGRLNNRRITIISVGKGRSSNEDGSQVSFLFAAVVTALLFKANSAFNAGKCSEMRKSSVSRETFHHDQNHR